MLLQGLRLPQLRLGPSVLPADGGRIPYLHPVKSVQDLPGSGLNPKPSYIYIYRYYSKLYTHTHYLSVQVYVYVYVSYIKHKKWSEPALSGRGPSEELSWGAAGAAASGRRG